MSAIKYLQDKEWGMGNGQCPECCGVPESWHGHPCHMTADSIGHKHDCPLSASLQGLGVKPLMKGEYLSDIEYEPYISDSGFYGTRPKTKDGCPKMKAENERFNKAVGEALNKAFDS